MPQPFYICKSTSKIDSYELEASSQLSLDDINGTSMAEGEPLTTMNFDDKIRIENLNLIRSFKIHHDFKVSQKGKVFEKPFSYYMIPNDFKMYYDKKKKLIIVHAAKDIAKDFLEELKDTYESFEYTPIKINLRKVVSKIENLKGAWLDVKRQNINQQAFFGNSVDRDSEVNAAIKRGQAKYINFTYEFSNEIYYIGLSNEGSIVIYENNLKEEERIRFLFNLYNSLLK